jgi:cytoskeleton protein RodZ
METRVGAVLRKARKRRKVELSEVEAATRIRVKYLLAIENEEWGQLPGGVYTRGFIRTYAAFLGLDGKRLADDYRREVEGVEGDPTAAMLRTPTQPETDRRQRRSLAPVAVLAVLLVGAAAVVGMPDGDGGEGGDGSSFTPPSQQQTQRAEPVGDDERPREKQRVPGVSMQLTASDEVWVCVLDGSGQHLVNGQILGPGAEEGPFRSGSFTVSFGNGEVAMLVNGREAEIPATSSPIGYLIDSSGKLTELSETERPTCT